MIFLNKVLALYKIEALRSTGEIETMAKHIMDKFFHDQNLPMPKFKIVNQLSSKSLGTTHWTTKDPTNTTITIQKSVVEDEETLKKIITHELIHHCEFMKEPPSQAQLKLGIRPSEHGKFFLDWAKKINATMGDGYVSVKSDQSYVTEGIKEYYVLIEPADRYGRGMDGKFGYRWAVILSTQQKERVAEDQASRKAKLVKTKDTRFTHGAKIKRYGPISIPSDDETQEKLKQMYEAAA